MSAGRLPFLQLRPAEDAAAVQAAIARVIERGWFVLGPELEAFETEFAGACGLPLAVGVGTGTDAIALALRALGIGPGDEVITTPLSAAYSALAIMMAGARPVFADIDPDRLTLDPDAAAAAVTPRTAALLPVHLYGQAADMEAIAAVAGRHNLAVVEDCCQAHLATCAGRPVGAFGAAAAFSFYPTKNLGALGDGGGVTTADAQLAERVRRLRNGGQTDRYHHAEPGVNSRLDEIQAAVLRARLPFLPGWTRVRRTLAAAYREALRDARSVRVPAQRDAGHVYHLFVVRAGQRQRLQGHLIERGIETLVHYPVPIPRQPAMAGVDPDPCPRADRVCDEILSLPLHPGLTEADVERTAAAIRDFGD
ncbi:MAG TPA: DegT/DnrJ/EryC1/StrS family aminotransferase [Vicinamibacterales bacterium]|nr:DegT/DnrJ/EryC1/StrS family aminotransferase [Vicinamibacterales bacterium]